MTDQRLVLGVPSQAHRDALLRETAGVGRVPTRWIECGPDACDHTCAACAGAGGWDALILRDASDPEAGAMGLARLAWVVDGHVDCHIAGSRAPAPYPHWAAWQTRPGGWNVLLWLVDGSREWSGDDVPTLRTATCTAHAVGLVAVHLGLLDRVEVVP